MAKVILITTSQRFGQQTDADLLFRAMSDRKPTTINARRIDEYDARQKWASAARQPILIRRAA